MARELLIEKSHFSETFTLSVKSLMEGRRVFLVLLAVVVSISLDCVCGSVLEVSVRPGDNVTIYCDCSKSASSRVYVVWFRNCSHENQPPLILNTGRGFNNIPHRFHPVRNFSSDSYDLLIQNVSASDEGFYYCGTTQQQVVDTGQIIARDINTFGNITTKIMLNTSDAPVRLSPPHHDVCWTLLFSLCPAFAVVSSLLTSVVVYCLCNKKDAMKREADQQTPDIHPSQSQDEDVCYAAVKISHGSQRPKKKKKPQSSDYCTYSAINTQRT